MTTQLSESTEMYLKAMLELGDRDVVAVGRLAERLSVTPVSANEMMRRLGEQGLVYHTPYKGVTLTEKGHEVACNVVRRQRLWECFLYDHLKIEWPRVYELACDLEHATAPAVTEALDVFLGRPSHCPYGDPIPSANGRITPSLGVPLSSIAAGGNAHVISVRATSTDVLKYLYDRQILPGAEIQVVDVSPLQGPLTLRVNGKDVALGLLLAEFVIVDTDSI